MHIFFKLALNVVYLLHQTFLHTQKMPKTIKATSFRIHLLHLSFIVTTINYK